jgi:aminopeptidase
MRLDYENPTLEWDKHIQTLERRASFLNDKNFEYIHFKNAKGTDLMVGLANDHQWISAREKAQDGIHFVANMPTEEVFTAPHREKVDGTLVSALPLCENGQIIDEFSITFKKGKIVDFTAKKGYETLKHLIETDSGTRRLGEIALIGKNSPVAKCNTLFYNTLFDENASCHLAIGKAYPTTVKNGESYSIKQLKEMGVNDSTEHIDFMIGTPDLQVTGIAKDGTKTTLFVDGEWVI